MTAGVPLDLDGFLADIERLTDLTQNMTSLQRRLRPAAARLVAELRRTEADLAAAVAERDAARTEIERLRRPARRDEGTMRTETDIRRDLAIIAEAPEPVQATLGRAYGGAAAVPDAACRLIDAVPALLAERDEALAEVAAVRKSAGDLHSEWMRQIEALKAERDEIEALKAERDEALARVEAVRALCDECVDSVPRALIRRTLDEGDGRTGDQE